MLTLDLLERLRAPEGEEILALAAPLAGEPFAAEKLRRETGVDAELAAAAVEQVRLRRRARAKFAMADRMWFTAALLEQASAEVAARHRAARYAEIRGVLGDFCCGLGGDALALAEVGDVVAVDRDPLALALVEANAVAAGLSGRIRTLRAELPDGAPAAAAAWIDPGRREGGRRTRRLEEMSPPLSGILSLRSRVPDLGIKLSPACDEAELDAALGDLPHEREFLSVRGELRELAVWLGRLARPERGPRRATLLPGGESLAGVPHPLGEIRAPGAYLLEPDPAVLRAGLVGNLAGRLGAWGLDPRLSYLSADRAIHTPFATLFRIEEAAPFRARALGERLRAAGAGDVVLKTRGSAVEPETLRRSLRGVLKHGRPQVCPVVFVTRLGGQAVMLLGERVGARSE